MKGPKWLAGAAVLCLAAAAVVAAPRAGRWYFDLAQPRAVKAFMGTTVWGSPADTVPSSAGEPEDVAMPRNDAARLLTNPVPSDALSIERGDRAYHSYCAACHGAEGHGDGPMAERLTVRPPNLAASLARRSDGYLYATIRDGGPIMPSQRERIPPQERWDIVNYLRSIAGAASQAAPTPTQTLTAAPPAAGQAAAPTPSPQGTGAAPVSDAAPQALAGDAARGRAVFEGRCQVCHIADSNEASVGPGLKGLFQWPPHALSDGTEHAAHTLAVISRQIMEGGGGMAPMGDSLSDQEMADLIAYLQTL